jgi:hypothetical protein
VAFGFEVEPLLDMRDQRFDATSFHNVGNEELESGAIALEAITVVPEELTDGLYHRPDLLCLEEIWKDLREVRRGAEPAADHHAEAALLFPVHRAFETEDTDVVDVGLGAMDAAAGDADLVFAGEIREGVVVDHAGIDDAHHFGCVEDFLRINPGHGAADDVARDIAASARRGDADAVHLAEDGRDVFDLQPVILDGHPRGDIAEAVGETVGEFADLLRLRAADLARREGADAS